MKHMIKTIAIVLGAIAVSLPAYAGDVIKFATEAAYPPFNQRAADGSIEGFEIDLGMEMCARVGLECEFVAQEWDGMIPGLLANKYDAIFASMSITEDRMKKIDFTDKYYADLAVFIGKEGTAVDLADPMLGGIAFGTIPGSTECHFLRDYPDANLRLYKNAENQVLDLVAGRVDAVAAYTTRVDTILEESAGKGLAVVSDSFGDAECFGSGVGIGVRKSDGELREKLNEAIASVRADGTYDKFMYRYFKTDIYGD
jgi:lysine-arginine-ornithine-binding protein